jgi:NADPH2:quinone reductase
MANMRAVVSSSSGPVLQDIAIPSPGPDEVLIRVKAAALNRADLGMLRGAAHGRVGGAGTPLGLELAGDVVETGTAVTGWRVGDRVMAASGSAFAEYALGHAKRIYPAPEGLSFEQAATFPVALQTEHDAIRTHGKLAEGQSVLVQGASSGVGLLALQIARFFGARTVLGTSTDPARRSQLAEYGAHLAINSQDDGWVQQVLDATSGKGVDLLIDHVAGALANGNLEATRIGGRIVNVGRLGGMTGAFNFDLHALRRITYVGVTFRTRSAAEVETIVAKTTQDLLPALSTGAFKLPIHEVIPLEQAQRAFEIMRRNEHFGKIVLSVA